MDREQRKFWVTCPHCRKAFGVEPRFVMKYLERVYRDRKERVSNLSDLLQSAQDDLAKRGEDAAKKRAS
jgi:hypothetical protein